MNDKVVLFAANNTAATEFLFEEVAGLPLILRNILTLSKGGIRNIEVLLPKGDARYFQKHIRPQLSRKGVRVRLKAYEQEPKPTYWEGKTKIAANGLVQKEGKRLKTTLIVDSVEKLKNATHRLTETIRLAALGPVARHFNKRISLPVSLLLSRFQIHPNAITLANMVLGIFSGIVVVKGTYGAYLLGALIFQFASIFDGCDGEVAKLTFTTSKFGQYFDSLSDNGALLSFFIGLTAAFGATHTPIATLALSLFLITGIGGLLAQMILFLKKHTDSASLAVFDKEYLSKLPLEKSSFLMRFIETGKIFMRKDCFSLVFFVAALLGTLSWWLYIAAVGTWIANGVLLYLKQHLAPVVEAQTDL